MRVGITQGDSNGIGYEVIIKALADERMLEFCTPVIYGSSKVFGFYRKQIHNLDSQANTNAVNSAAEIHPKRINIVNCLPDNVFVEPGQPTAESAKAAITALERAVADLKSGLIDVLVTGPINKRSMAAEGFGHTGHTEFLQKQFGTEDIAMIMVSDNLKVCVATGHIPLSTVSSTLSEELILKKLRLMKHSLERDFAIPSPKIAVLGLNPHCGDGGLLGDEEQRIILPAIQKAVDEDILAFGPYSSDGFFGFDNYGKYDAILAMYHDQGLTPFKALEFSSGVNFTAGLPIVRTSPDHGTAFEVAGKDRSDARSMTAAIFTAITIYNNRVQYDELLENQVNVEMPEIEFHPRGDKVVE